ncbi:hypothetical protein [Amycolatopsis pigmentata]|uniref:Uncharacterized protein n=1 Tax=Amycolatopsis pigmentata TaxID=450801 RepID=A0ABW5FTB8_9PSEU
MRMSCGSMRATFAGWTCRATSSACRPPSLWPRMSNRRVMTPSSFRARPVGGQVDRAVRGRAFGDELDFPVGGGHELSGTSQGRRTRYTA